MKSILALALIVLTTTRAFAEVPLVFDHLELIFRSGEFDGHNVGAGTFISNAHVKANDAGDAAVTLKGIEYSADFGLWRYDASSKTGNVIYRAPNERLVSNPTITKTGELLFTQFDLGVNDGILKIDRLGKLTTVLERKDVERGESFSDPAYTKSGALIYKAISSEGERALMLYENGVERELIAEGSGASYVFSPSSSSDGVTALKVRIGELGQWSEDRPDQITLYKNGKLSVVMDDGSGYASSFNNNLGVNNRGEVAIIADHKKGRRLLRTHAGSVQVIALQGAMDDIKEFETFAPAINDQGHVVFRAIDMRERRSLYYFNGTKLTKILSEGDLVPTDRETGRIEHREGWPGFSSAPTLTNSDTLYFHCQLWNKSEDQHLGAALYKLSLEFLN